MGIWENENDILHRRVSRTESRQRESAGNMCTELQVCLIALQSKEFILNLIQWNIIIEETKGILIYKAVLEING